MWATQPVVHQFVTSAFKDSLAIPKCWDNSSLLVI